MLSTYNFENHMVLEPKTLKIIESQKVPAEGDPQRHHPLKCLGFPAGETEIQRAKGQS